MESALRLALMLLRGLGPGDVDHDALHQGRVAVRVPSHGIGLVVDPHHAAVSVESPILHVELAARSMCFDGASHQGSAIVGMDPIHPEPRVRGPLGGGVAEEHLDLRADEVRSDLTGRSRRVPGIDHDGGLLDQQAIAPFGIDPLAGLDLALPPAEDGEYGGSDRDQRHEGEHTTGLLSGQEPIAQMLEQPRQGTQEEEHDEKPPDDQEVTDAPGCVGRTRVLAHISVGIGRPGGVLNGSQARASSRIRA